VLFHSAHAQFEADAEVLDSLFNDNFASVVVAAFELESQLCTVTSYGVNGIRLADQTDPGRTNPAIRDSNQRLLKIGAKSPIVSRILLTAERLFNPAYLADRICETSITKIEPKGPPSTPKRPLTTVGYSAASNSPVAY
jgi:hypothetical protein